MTGKLEGKVAIVTGAASGIGAGAALEFLRQGAKLVMADWDEERLQSTCAELKEKTGGEAVVVVANVAKDDDNRRIVETAMSSFGALHVSFINAGVASYTALMDMTDEKVDYHFGSNFKGVVFGLKHQLPAISKTWDKGSIVVTTSVASSRIFSDLPGMSLYGCSKAAASMMVKYGAVEGAQMNVRVNGIAPGLIKTPLSTGMVGQGMDFPWTEGHLGGKPIKVEHIAPLVMFLMSEEAQALTGSIYYCDSGTCIKT